jgi:uncharacterized membrane protein
MTSQEIADLTGHILGVCLAAILWGWLWWHVITKIGYQGLLRRLWLVGMCIPPLFAIVMVLLLVLPWPICRQLRQLKKQQSDGAIDDELRQLRSNL